MSALSTSANAAETVCNDNGGVGWPIPDPSVTNVSIPFNFGDVSRAHDINVQVDISKAYVGDLSGTVTSPGGSSVLLFERPGTTNGENDPSPPWGCNRNDMLVTFDDEAAVGTNVESVCNAATPTISGTYLPQAATGNDLAAIDGEDPNGNWNFRLTHVAPYDPGTLNEVCITAAFAAVTFDKWVSSSASCSDSIDAIAIAPGTDVYFCYTVTNPSTETFSINPGDWSDDQGHNLSPLERTYNQNDNFTYIEGPIVAGSAALPLGTTVNNASVTGTFATANFNGTLTTAETATAIVANPIINTSTKTVVDQNGGSAEPGDVLRYTITINETAGIYVPDVQLTDIVDANLTSINIISIPTGATDNTAGNNIDISDIVLAANGTETIVFDATIDAATPAGTNINNTANIAHAASGVTFDAIAPTVIVSAPDLSTSTKTELDVNGTPALPGDLVRYTITINETGGNPASNVTLTDTIDPNLVSVNVVSIPAGAVDNTVGNNVNITNIAVPANGNATVIIEANIIATASVGTNIDNTATVTDAVSSETASPTAGTIVVGGLPASGVKQLYTANLGTTVDLTRVVPVANTNSANITSGNFLDIDQAPVFQSPFTITGGSTVNVFLNLQRRNGNGARTAQVDLYNGNTGALLGSASQTWNSGATQYLTFAYPIAADTNFSVNDFVRVRVRNTSANGRNIRVASLIGGNQSQVQMQSSTVVNVDAIEVYAAAYPATTQYSSYTPGSTVFIRATTSDPFGNADISAANVTITDPTPSVQLNNAAMTSVATPTGATRIFEYQYTVPATPDGFWDISVTANEGTEGTVSHTAQANMIIGTTNIVISKNNTVISDPINATNPKAIPNAIIEYTLSVSNTGFGFADNNTIELTDPLPAQTTLFLGSPVNPAQFTDGFTASGLTFTFTSLASTTDDIAFSNNGGSTFITPSVDGNGFDITVPPINFIRFTPKGALRGSDGSNNPSFDIQFRLRVD